MACGEPEVRRNGLRISVELSKNNSVMKKLLISILMLLPVTASAYDFTSDGIYYKIITWQEGNTVWVDKGDDYYEGEVIIPSSVSYNGIEYKVTGIDSNAFKDNTRLKKVTIPQSIESLSSTFSGCSGLTEVILPGNLKEIGYYTFYNCSNLENISLPSQLETILTYAFSDCVSLKEIFIPQTVVNISGSLFQNCPSLNSIVVEDGNSKYDSRGNCNAIIEKETLCLISGCRNTIIPEETKTIGDDAFYGCTKLQSISIPESVMEMGDRAFGRCTGLKIVKLPTSLTIIPTQLFDECSSLESIELPSGLTSIGVFKCSALTSITLPGTVREIGKYAFAYTPLQSIMIPEGITELESDIFKECHNLNKVFLPSTLKKIGNETFWRCYSLYNVWCYAPVAPYTTTSTFESAPYQYARLHIYKSALDDYKATWPWSDFAEYEFIKEGDKEQCAKPTIMYEQGRIIFTCETEGAEFSYEILDDDIQKGKGESISLTATYIISVYATADGYDDSEVATASLCWIDAELKTEGMTSNIATARGNAILIQSNNGTMNISGVSDGANIAVYSSSGIMVGFAKASSSSTSINTGLRNGEIAIVKIGDKAVKVVMK